MKRRTKERIKAVMVVWQLIVITILSAGLIPLFLAQRARPLFFTLTVMTSILAYLILTTIQLRLRRGILKRFLESVSTRLLLALIALALAGVTGGLLRGVVQSVLLVTAAVLYAALLQKVSFVRVFA